MCQSHGLCNGWLHVEPDTRSSRNGNPNIFDKPPENIQQDRGRNDQKGGSKKHGIGTDRLNVEQSTKPGAQKAQYVEFLPSLEIFENEAVV